MNIKTELQLTEITLYISLMVAFIVTFYKSWELVPIQFQKMVKELDNRSGLAKKNDDYFLEVINGIYYLTMPDGTIKKYKRLTDVPAYIRKAVGKL